MIPKTSKVLCDAQSFSIISRISSAKTNHSKAIINGIVFFVSLYFLMNSLPDFLKKVVPIKNSTFVPCACKTTSLFSQYLLFYSRKKCLWRITSPKFLNFFHILKNNFSKSKLLIAIGRAGCEELTCRDGYAHFIH